MPDLLERLKSALADRYAVEREIGRGGMATVFLAEDLKHHRQVAVKVLHPELAASVGTDRFLREIEAVAGLTHPHVLPLHDSGEANGLLFYIMPYVEGESLRQRLNREKQLPVEEAIRITQDVAGALDHAHRHSLIHRDIKPGNILLEEGHAVVTDFGVARAISDAGTGKVTATGMALGTPAYMSPEQAAGEEVDERSDLYALGCVLYEMLAGEPPLTGATPQMIQARRMSETPTALHTLRDTVPPALDHVIARALARIPADRYATASQFGQALQAVLFAATPEAMADLAATPGALAMTPSAVAPGPKRKVSRWMLFAVPILGISVVIAGVMLTLSSGGLGGGPLEITTSNIWRVTTERGWEFQPTLSPDGKEVAYLLWRLDGNRTVVRSTLDVGRGGESRPGEELGDYHFAPSWTPNGASVRFMVCELGIQCDWKLVGRLGGSVTSLGGVPDDAVWSRDGTRFAFESGDSIFASPRVGSEPELLGVHTVEPRGLHSLAWSPDGRRIAYVNGNRQWGNSDNKVNSSVWVLDVASGQTYPVTDGQSINQSPEWLPDSRHLLFVSDRHGARGVYIVAVGDEGPRGRAQRVPGPSNPHTISVSGDGRKLAYSSFESGRYIRAVPIRQTGAVSIADAVPVTRQALKIQEHDPSPDGEWIAFDTDLGGEFAIYKQRTADGQPELVASVPGGAYEPSWSPDGTEIAFASTHWRGVPPGEIFVVPVSGGTPQRITKYPGDDHSPDWSPDGLSIAYARRSSEEGAPSGLWVVSRVRVGQPWGDPVQLTDFRCLFPDWAPDGSGVLCDGSTELVFVSPKGEVLWRYADSTSDFRMVLYPRFSETGSRIYFWAMTEDNSWDVWSIPTDGGSATKAVMWDPVLGAYGMSVGTDHIYFTVAESEGDIWVMDLEW